MTGQLLKRARSVLIGFLLGYLVICFGMWAFQRHLLFHPTHDNGPPASYGLTDFSDIRLQAEDGTRLQAWNHAAKPGFPTLIYFHGNGGTISHRAEFFQLLSEKGFGVLALEYRGYGASEGKPSEQGLYQDARATTEFALRDLNVAQGKIIFYGASLGTGVAVQMASEYHAGGIVLQSPYASIPDIGADRYPWLPVRLLASDRFESLRKISDVHVPLLLMHGEQDEVVPVRYGRSVFDAANEPKRSVFWADRGHNNLVASVLANEVEAFAREQKLID